MYPRLILWGQILWGQTPKDPWGQMEKGERLAFSDIWLVRLRDVPDGAKELRQVPKTKK